MIVLPSIVTFGMDDRVAADLGFGTDVCVRRIDKRHAVFDHQSADGRAAEEVLKLSQLGARVDSGNFAAIVVQIDTDSSATRQNDLGNVRQVILALIVRRLDFAAERSIKFLRVKAVDAAS